MKRSKTDGVPRTKSLTTCEKQNGKKRVSNRLKTNSQTSCSYKTDSLPSADKTKVVKTLIRNPTVKSKLSVKVKVPQNSKETISSSSSKETENATPSCSSVNEAVDYDLKVPSLCTALRIADDIVTATVESRNNLVSDLASSSKTSVNKKVTLIFYEF